VLAHYHISDAHATSAQLPQTAAVARVISVRAGDVSSGWKTETET